MLWRIVRSRHHGMMFELVVGQVYASTHRRWLVPGHKLVCDALDWYVANQE